MWQNEAQGWQRSARETSQAFVVRRGTVAKGPGGVITAVGVGSLGWTVGLEPGDRLVSINDYPLRDIIDVQFYSAEDTLALLVEREGRQLLIQGQRPVFENAVVRLADGERPDRVVLAVGLYRHA